MTGLRWLTAGESYGPAPEPGRPARPGRAPAATTSPATPRRPPEPGRASRSFAFFPPESRAAGRPLPDSLPRIEGYTPTFASVTCGAGRVARERTVEPTPVSVTCGAGRAARERTVEPTHRVAAETIPHPAARLTHARELVRLVRGSGNFRGGVAAFPARHPGPPDRESEIPRPAEPSGAAFPAPLAESPDGARDDPATTRRVGVDHTTAPGRRLLAEGAPGPHPGTLDRSPAAPGLHEDLVPLRSPALRPAALSPTG